MYLPFLSTTKDSQALLLHPVREGGGVGLGSPEKDCQYRVVKCDVIKNLILEFLNFFFIFRKSIKNNVQMSKNNEYVKYC